MRRISRTTQIIVLAIVIGGFLLVLSTTLRPSPPNETVWKSTAPYPGLEGQGPGVVGQSCVGTSARILCVGGEGSSNEPTAAVYGAQSSSSGLGNWTSESVRQYPFPIMFESCVLSASDIYCVGGVNDENAHDVNSTFYASLNSTGALGQWIATTSYPATADALSCVAGSGELICIGGENETNGSNSTTTYGDTVWYTTIGSSGLGTWNRATPYPAGVYFPSCGEFSGFVYCTGGEDAAKNPVNATYYASVSPSGGIGPWVETSALPTPTLAPSCVASGGDLYCIGGFLSGGATSSSVYYAAMTPGGLGAWQTGANYPTQIATDCIASSDIIYCIGGYLAGSGPTDSSSFAMLVPTTSTTPSASSKSGV